MNRKLLFPLLSACFVAVACGSEDEQAPVRAAATPEPTHAAFVAEGNRLCTQFTAEIGELSVRMLGEGEPTPEKASKFAAAAVPITEQSLRAIAAVPAPKADRPKLDKLLANYRAGIEAFRAAGESPKVAEELLQGEDPFAAANASARDLGLTDCDS